MERGQGDERDEAEMAGKKESEIHSPAIHPLDAPVHPPELHLLDVVDVGVRVEERRA